MAQTSFSFRQYWKKHHFTILGLVLMAIAAIYAILAYHFPLKQTTEIKTIEPQGKNKETNKTSTDHNSPPLSTHDTPEKIMSEIDSAPPLQQPDIAKTYNGIPVDWTLFYISGSAYKDEYRLLLGSSLNLSKTHIHCTIPKANNDYLRRLQKNAKLRVQGAIDKIEFGIIYLKDVNVFPEPL